MMVMIVRFKVKPECQDAFQAACIENARGSLQEPGVARFDLIHEAEDPTRFMFVEAFRSVDAHAVHRETPHYLTWRDTVADMVTERSAVRHFSVFPDDSGW